MSKVAAKRVPAVVRTVGCGGWVTEMVSRVADIADSISSHEKPRSSSRLNRSAYLLGDASFAGIAQMRASSERQRTPSVRFATDEDPPQSHVFGGWGMGRTVEQPNIISAGHVYYRGGSRSGTKVCTYTASCFRTERTGSPSYGRRCRPFSTTAVARSIRTLLAAQSAVGR